MFLIENLGAATIGFLTFYVAKYVVMRPDLTGFFILLYIGASIGFVPIWLPLSRRSVVSRISARLEQVRTNDTG